MIDTVIKEVFLIANEARKPDPPYTVSQWADKNRYLNTVASAEPGLWRTKRTPYLREIMDNLSSYVPVETTVVMKGAQIGMSEAALNFCGYAIHHSPGPALYVMPTVDLAKRVSKNRLDPMIEASPALSERISPARARDKGNTMFSKEFDGGTLMLTGANSAASLRSMPVRYLVLDEVDAYPLSVDRDGDPLTLAEERTSSFVKRKIFKLSTPTHRDISRIAQDFVLGDQRYYNVPCDGCGTLQPIVWSQIKWPKGAPEKAVFVCAHCGHEHAEHRKEDLLSEERGACWIPTQEPSEPGLRSYHISALYSPWRTWKECVRKFLKVKNDPARLQAFVNTVLGEPWEDKSGEVIDPDSLYAQREDYPLAPAQVVLLTAGIDVQNDRLELEVVGWGRDEESWNIDYQVLPGNPSSLDVWDQLDEYLQKRWPHPGFKDGIQIAAACIDTGGNHTQDVYNYVRPREGKRIWGIKGQAGPRPVWPRRPSKNNKGQINLYIVGVDSAKNTITSRFKNSGPEASGAGATHFHKNLDREYFEQLTAEKKVIKYFKGHQRIEWHKSDTARNEAFDCRVYAYAALQGLILAGLNLNKEVDILEERLKNIESPSTDSYYPKRLKPEPEKQFIRTSISAYMQGNRE